MNPEKNIQNFYPEFRDKVLLSASRRGEDKPTWDDIWMESSDNEFTSDVLIKQGISPVGLKRDLEFSLHFGKPDPKNGVLVEIPSTDPVSNALNEAIYDVRSFAEAQNFGLYNDRAVQRIMNHLVQYVGDIQESIEDPNIETNVNVMALVGNFIEGFIAQYKPSQFNTLGIAKSKEEELLESSLRYLIAEDVLPSFVKYMESKRKVIATQNDPIKLFDTAELSSGKTATVSPFAVVDTAKKKADPFTKYLLHRNGVIAPEGYEAPYSMPHKAIINNALKAKNVAEDLKVREVDIEHLLPTLLMDPNVSKILIKLDKDQKIAQKREVSPIDQMFGITDKTPDLIRFYQVVTNAITPQRDGGDVFKVRPRTSHNLENFLNAVQSVVSEGPEELANARMFGELVKNERVAEILTSAGLTQEQLDRWPEELAEATEKAEKEAKIAIVKDTKELKVPDWELNSLLEKYASDRTKLALESKLDPVIGRSKEIDYMVEILLRRGKSNPLILGEPGVGKTALFDGLSSKIASGDVPEKLIGAKFYTIDLHAMNSGAMYRGQFEERLLPIINGVAERNRRGEGPPIILGIDEIHSALSAGTAQGTDGAGELIKPALAAGDVMIVGATTHRDYAKHMENDGALTRRFEPLNLEQPNTENTIEIITGLQPKFEEHHKISMDPQLIPQLVKLTDRYLPSKNQPDKSITAFDATYAHARMRGQTEVDISTIIEIIASQANLNAEFLSQDESERFSTMKERLLNDVIGQEDAVEKVFDALSMAKAGLQDPRRPLGVFLFLGPTGVGKTELAKSLARIETGSEDSLVRIAMETMQEKITSTNFFGAPPGYIGYGEEGQLTGQVRRKPYAVVLLDEIEKAHPDIKQSMLSIFDDGMVKDGRGQLINFRNTIIIMTSNLGALEAQKAYRSRGDFLRRDDGSWRKHAQPVFEEAVKNHFSPEFLNRIDEQVIFDPLSRDAIHQLVGRELDMTANRLVDKWGVTIDASSTYDHLAHEGYNEEYGARHLKRTVRKELVAPLAHWVLSHSTEFQKGDTILISGTGPEMKAEIKRQ